MIRRPPRSTLFPYTPLSRSNQHARMTLLAISASQGTDNSPGTTVAEPLPRKAKGSSGLETVVSLPRDRKSTRLNSSHGYISYAVFCLKKKKQNETRHYEL